MRYIAVWLFMTLMFPAAAWPKDYVAELIKQNFKRSPINRAGNVNVYHTLQVNTKYGNKLLVLKGNDMELRSWLKDYFEKNKMLVIHLTDEESTVFEDTKSMTFDIDLSAIHPLSTINLDPLKENGKEDADMMGTYSGVKRILIVDDEEENIILLKNTLEQLGYQVEGETDPIVAWDKIRRHGEQYALLITDQIMPQMTGTRLSEKVMELKPDLPIILGTGSKEMVESQMKAEHTGIREYVSKPYVLSDIGRMVKQLVVKEKKDEK